MVLALGFHASTVVRRCTRWEDADEIVDIPVSCPLPTLVPGLYPERELLGPEFRRIADEQYPKWQASARLRTLVPVRLFPTFFIPVLS
jgi:hypothetical protein